MKVIITKIDKLGHRTLMIGRAIPSWWERIFLLRFNRETVAFVGKGKKWYHHPGTTPVSKRLARELENREQYYQIYKQ